MPNYGQLREQSAATAILEKFKLVEQVSGKQQPEDIARATQRNFDHLLQLLNRALPTLMNILDPDHQVLVATLGETVQKLTSTGPQGVTAGAITELNDLDDVGDGTTYARTKGTELDAGQVKRVKKTAGVVDADDLLDANNNDADDLPESGTRKWAGATGADFVKSIDDSDGITEGSTKKFVGSGGSGDMDDVDDSATYIRVASVDASHHITTSSVASEAITNAKVSTSSPLERSRLATHAVVGRLFDELVVDEYQAMGSTLTDNEFDDLET